MKPLTKKIKEKHEFALFVPTLSSLLKTNKENNEFILQDEQIIQRIQSILRLTLQETCILFDRTIHAQCIIQEFINKKQIRFYMITKKFNKNLQPSITFLLPILKRNDLENTLYSLTEIGISTIQLIVTQKTQGFWNEKHDVQRAQRIIIAAAEQSKNFAYPELRSPITLTQAIQEQADNKLFFDPNGVTLFNIMNTLYQKNPQTLLLCVGPEGDFTIEEKQLIKNNNFIFCALTPTILRATQAATLGAGFARSLLSS